MERITITVHHFVTMVTVLLTLTALIIASLAISGHIDYKDNSIEATAINNHSGLFLEHPTGNTPSAVIDAVLSDGELGAQVELNAVAGDNTLSLGGVAVTASAAEINRLSGVTKHGNGFHAGGSGIILEDADGSNYLILDSPASVTTNYTLTFPSTVAAGYLKADAAGVLSFAAANDNPKLQSVQNGDASTPITLTNNAAMTFGTTVGKLQLKASTDVELNADSGIIKLIDNVTTFGALTQTGNELVIKSGTTPTTAMTFSGADVTHSGSVTVVKDSANAELIISSHHDTEATTPLITLRKSDNTAAAPALVDDDAVLGTIQFSGYDGSGYHVGAKIEARVNGTPSDGTDMPTELTFWTTPDGAGVPVERLVIDQDGSVDIKGTGTFKLAGVAITSTAAELNFLDTSAVGTVIASKAVIYDGSGNVKANDLIIADGGDIGSVSDTDAISISAGGVVTLSATTSASSMTTGALVVAGGLGVSKNLYIGGICTMKNTATGDDNPMVLTLQTGETDIAADDKLGVINFQAPDEGTGTDAILVAAGIEAISEGDFSATNNATKLSFKTAASEAATEKMTLSSGGVLGFSSGGAVAQGGAKTTGVTLNKPSGKITMNGGALADDAIVTFALTNDKISTSSCVIVNHASVGDLNGYQISASNMGIGSCDINVRNISGSSLGEAIVLNFIVLNATIS